MGRISCCISNHGVTMSQQSVKLGSLNVHGGHSGYKDSFKKLCQLIKDNDLDLIAMQEAPIVNVRRLQQHLGSGWEFIFQQNNAVLTRLPLASVYSKDGMMSEGVLYSSSPLKKTGNFRRFCWARVALSGWRDGGKEKVSAESEMDEIITDVISIHLDHQHEKMRMLQIQALHETVCLKNTQVEEIIWMGDFNALTREDYSESKWQHIADVRSLNRWEAPVTKVTDWIVNELLFVNLWTEAGLLDNIAGSNKRSSNITEKNLETNEQKCGEDAKINFMHQVGGISTCRFDTHIDYIYTTPALSKRWSLEQMAHVVAMPDISDHNLVVATLSLQKNE